MEIWRPVVGYEGIYEVSNLGNVRRLKIIDKKIIYNPVNQVYSKGWQYNSVHLHTTNKKVTKLVHRLVAETFLVNLENKPEVNHIDGDKLNNKLSNLEWVTKSENCLHAQKIGLRKTYSGDKSRFRKLNSSQVKEIRNLLENKISYVNIANKFSVSKGCIWLIAANRTWVNIA